MGDTVVRTVSPIPLSLTERVDGGRLKMDRDKIEQGVRLVLEGIGEDPTREGLVETPRRVADMYGEIFSGLGQEPEELLCVTFDEGHQEMVLVRDIALYSVCEHHLVPFMGKAHVAYIPGKSGRICGLSKLARVVDVFAKRPQVQERLTSQIADTIVESLDPAGVMVVIEAEHLCMSMRGVRKPGAVTTTSAVRGVFRKSAATRAEAMALIKG
jgi:GTP cyclohydrolase IA